MRCVPYCVAWPWLASPHKKGPPACTHLPYIALPACPGLPACSLASNPACRSMSPRTPPTVELADLEMGRKLGARLPLCCAAGGRLCTSIVHMPRRLIPCSPAPLPTALNKHHTSAVPPPHCRRRRRRFWGGV